MALQVVIDTTGNKVVIYAPPLLRYNTLTAPSYKAVQDAITELKRSVTPSQVPALNVLISFIETR